MSAAAIAEAQNTPTVFTARENDLLTDPHYGAAMCFIKYLSWNKGSWPPRNNLNLMAKDWKSGYNSAQGKGTILKFEKDWRFMLGTNYVVP